MVDDDISPHEVKRRAARGTISVFTRHAVVRALAFVGTLALARVIDPKQFGVFAIAQFILIFATSVCVGGVIAALTRRKKVTESELKTAFVLQESLAFVGFAVIFLSAPAISDLYKLGSDGALILRLMGGCVFLQSLRSIPNVVLQQMFRHDLIAVSDVVEYLTYTVTAVGLAYLLHWGIWALVTATIARHAAATLYLHVAARHLPQLGYDSGDARTILRYALPLQLTILSNLGTRAVIPVFLGLIVSVEAVGIGNMTQNLIDAVAFQPLALLSNIQIRTLAHAQDKLEKVRSRLALWYFVCAAAFFPLLLVMAFQGQEIVNVLFSARWHSVGALLMACAVASLPLPLLTSLSQAIKALGDMRSSLGASILNFAAQALVMLMCGRWLGIMALPLAWGAGNVSTLAFCLWRVPPKWRGDPFGASVSPLIAALVACGAGFLVPGSSGHWWLAIQLTVTILIYVTLLCFLGGRRLAQLLRMTGDASGSLGVREKCAELLERLAIE